MLELTLRNTLTGDNINLFGSIRTLLPVNDPDGDTWLYSGAQATGSVTRFRLTDQGAMDAPVTKVIAAGSQTFRVEDLAVYEQGGAPRLFASGLGRDDLTGFARADNGTLSGQTQISAGLTAPATQIETFEVSGKQFLATGSRDGSGLHIYDIAANGALSQRSVVADHTKVAAADTADLTHVTIDGQTFLIAGSVNDAGLSSYRVDSAGRAELIDTIGAKDGLWLSGLDSVTPVRAGGVDYVVVGGLGSSSLSLVRINKMGVLFAEDHVFDTLDSRFSKVDSVTGFTVEDRGFIVAGGADHGLTLLEILPDRSLFQHGVIAHETGDALANISALAAVDTGTEIQVIAAGQPGLTLASLSKSAVAAMKVGGGRAETLNGTARADLIWADSGNDTVSGGAGDDILSGGAGYDRLTGGAGADVFVFHGESARDVVTDFEFGIDRLDLSRWGRIYDVSSLTIRETADGAVVSHGTNSVQLIADDHDGISPDLFTNDSFLF